MQQCWVTCNTSTTFEHKFKKTPKCELGRFWPEPFNYNHSWWGIGEGAVVDRIHCAHSSFFELDLYSSVPFTKRGKGKDFLSKGHYRYAATSLYVLTTTKGTTQWKLMIALWFIALAFKPAFNIWLYVDTRPCDLSSLLCPLQYVWPYDLIQWPCSHEFTIAKCIHTSNQKVVGVMPRLEHSDWVFQCFLKWPLKLTHL